MHPFSELVYHGAHLTLRSLSETQTSVHAELEHSGATRLVKALQMIELQRAILAVGIFSMFEAYLQGALECENGFAEARTCLRKAGEDSLLERFNDVYLAINALKHGRGKSYDQLVAKASALPFWVKPNPDKFFHEGDVSEVAALIRVDDEFVMLCCNVIHDVSESIRRHTDRFF
ncbi:MAG: hypothetical protein EAZ30_13515 [Betaproteobacteria bacterium]|nr:MAG: hypothetical protein EAZ30_13515 [Betaproteobacteria bacterium]